MTGLGDLSDKVPTRQRVCVNLWRLCEESRASPEKYKAALDMQELVSNVDYDVQKIGISGMKALLNRLFGYGIAPRRPLLPTKLQVVDKLLGQDSFKQLLQLETKLAESL